MTVYPVNMDVTPDVSRQFDPPTNTISYIVRDPNFTSCAMTRDQPRTLNLPRSLMYTSTSGQRVVFA